MENKKVPPSTMLRWAKTKSAFREQKNVKDAKLFSDLTPAKQKIIKEQYEKRRVKKSKNITNITGSPPSKNRIETGKLNPGKVVKEKRQEINRETPPTKILPSSLIEPKGFKSGETFKVVYDTGIRESYFPKEVIIGEQIKKYTAAQKKSEKYTSSLVGENVEEKKKLLNGSYYGDYYLSVKGHSNIYRPRFIVDFKKKKVLQVV